MRAAVLAGYLEKLKGYLSESVQLYGDFTLSALGTKRGSSEQLDFERMARRVRVVIDDFDELAKRIGEKSA
jgi:hypothetical protein